MRAGPVSTATALDGPTRHHGQSRVGLLHPSDGGVVLVAAAASVPDVDVGLQTLVRKLFLTR